MIRKPKEFRWPLLITLYIAVINIPVVSGYLYKVKENANIGSIIGNVLNISTNVDITKIDFLRGNGVESLFELDKVTGNIRVKSYIDRESICPNRKSDNCSMGLLLDLGDQIETVDVLIQDENDNVPGFSHEERPIYIQENIKIGTRYSLPLAHDRDTSKYGVAQYRLRSMKGVNSEQKEKYIKDSMFMRINTSSPVAGTLSPYLEIVGNIDREEYGQFSFVLEAVDRGDKVGSCSVTVRVLDVNDNAPEWSSSHYRVNIKECQAPGEILHLQARDRDDASTPNGKVTYRISDSTEDRQLMSQIFYVIEDRLHVSSHRRVSELVADGRRERVRLGLVAEDGNGRSSEAEVLLHVADCNDHAPVISVSPRHMRLPENEKQAQALATVSVVDKDRRRNGMFECRLNDSSRLTLLLKHHPIGGNGGVSVYKIQSRAERPFDREMMVSYSVAVLCEDQGNPPRRSRAVFSLQVQDRNDNPPHFQTRFPVFRIAENNPIGGTVGRLKAMDPDERQNGQIWYRISGPDSDSGAGSSNIFTVSSYGEIQAKVKFDREKNDSYEFTVTAFDQGQPPLNDTVTVKVIVKDVNDCYPRFSQDYFFEVEESSGRSVLSVLLGHINATDGDAGKNGAVSYQLVDVKSIGGRGSARIHKHLQQLVRVSHDGVINVYGNLDREQVSSFQMTVRAHDNGDPSLSSTTEVVVKVLDVNDNTPEFTKTRRPHTINVSLSQEIGSPLASVVAVDLDNGDNGTVEHSIINPSMPSLSSNSGTVAGESQFPFDMSAGGQLVVSADLSRYLQSGRSRSHRRPRLPDRLIIKASDKGIPPRSSIVTLILRYSRPPQIPLPRDQTSTPRAAPRRPYGPKRAQPPSHKQTHPPALSDSMVLLYSLAAILFFIFTVVFSVLVYVYCSKKYAPHDRYGKKPPKSSSSQLNIENNMKEMKPISESIQHSRDELSSKTDYNSTMCFLNETGSSGGGDAMSSQMSGVPNYTHLMMLNNCKYTPMLHHHPQQQQQPGTWKEPYLGDTTQPHQLLRSTPGSMPRMQRFASANEAQNYATLRDNIPTGSASPRPPHLKMIISGGDKVDYTSPGVPPSSAYVTSSFV